MIHITKIKKGINIEKLLKKENINLYKNDSVFISIPTGISEEIEYFKLDRYITDNELEEEYESRGLSPVSPYSLILSRINNPEIEKLEYTATHWKDADGKWCFAAFGRRGVERYLRVFRLDYDWHDFWWFAGVRKSALNSETLNPSLISSELMTLPDTLTINGIVYVKK